MLHIYILMSLSFILYENSDHFSIITIFLFWNRPSTSFMTFLSELFPIFSLHIMFSFLFSIKLSLMIGFLPLELKYSFRITASAVQIKTIYQFVKQMNFKLISSYIQIIQIIISLSLVTKFCLYKFSTITLN